MNSPEPSDTPDTSDTANPSDGSGSAETGVKRGLRRVPVGIWLFIALGVIIGVGFGLFALASLWNGSSGPDTSTIVLGLILPR